MRELGFAIVGATALIVLGLWALGRTDNQEWSDAVHSSQAVKAASSYNVSATVDTVVAPESVRLLNKADPQE